MIAIAALLALAAPVPQERTWPDVEGWTIAEVSGGCGMLFTYEGKGSTNLVVLLHTDGKPGIVVSNDLWSIRDKAQYELGFLLNGALYEGLALGARTNGRPAFTLQFAPSFLDDLAKAPALVITRGDTLVDNLSLSGSAAATAMLRRCVAVVSQREAAEERERARLAHIPDDPFAEAEPDVPPPVARRLSPRGDPAGWITAADYPAEALRRRAEGATGFRLDVSADGRVTACTITSSSGDALLDEATCTLLRRRARFMPAQDASGNPIPATYPNRYVWKLPPS